MPRPGSNAITRTSSAPRCSTPSRWAFTRPPRSCAMRANTASRFDPSTSTRPAGTAPWSRPKRTGALRCGWVFGMVRGLANDEAGHLLPAAPIAPFTDVEDIWRRSGVQVGSLVRWPKPMPFAPPLGLAAAKRSGRSRRCATIRCPFRRRRRPTEPTPEANEEPVRPQGHDPVMK